MKRLMGAFLALSALPLLAGSPKVGGKLYIGYFYETTDGEKTTRDYNYFHFTRFYFTVKGKHLFSEEGKAYIGYKFTTDAKDINKKGYYEVFIKYAFLEIGELLPGLKIRLGQLPTPWIGNEEHIWGFRFVDPVMVDKFKYMSSTDRGLGFVYKSPQNFVEVMANIANGEGYHKSERTKHKDGMGRVSIFPLAMMENKYLKGFNVLGYAHYGFYNEDTVRNRYIVGVAEKTGVINFMVSYFIGQDGPSSNPIQANGISAHGFIDIGKIIFTEVKRSFGFFFRYDKIDPNADTTNDGIQYITGGIFARPCVFIQSTDKAIISLNISRTQYEDSKKNPDMILRLNAEIKF